MSEIRGENREQIPWSNTLTQNLHIEINYTKERNPLERNVANGRYTISMETLETTIF